MSTQGNQGWPVNPINGQFSAGPLCVTTFENYMFVFYRGNGGADDFSINYTVSTDGVNWSPVLTLWEQGVTNSMSVTVANGNVYLVYTGGGNQIWVTSAPLSSLAKK